MLTIGVVNFNKTLTLFDITSHFIECQLLYRITT